jgi:hypothetical protein
MMYQQKYAEVRIARFVPTSETRSWLLEKYRWAKFWTFSILAAVIVGMIPALIIASSWNSTNVETIDLHPVPNATNFPEEPKVLPDRRPVMQNPNCWIEDPGWPHDC